MNYARQEELRLKYSLITRGFLTMRNILQEILLSHSTGDPFFDENEEVRRKVLNLVKRVSEMANREEIEALIAEYGPEARQVLG